MCHVADPPSPSPPLPSPPLPQGEPAQAVSTYRAAQRAGEEGRLRDGIQADRLQRLHTLANLDLLLQAAAAAAEVLAGQAAAGVAVFGDGGMGVVWEGGWWLGGMGVVASVSKAEARGMLG